MKRKRQADLVVVHVTWTRDEAKQLMRRVRSDRSNAWNPKDAALLAIAILKLEEALGEEGEADLEQQ